MAPTLYFRPKNREEITGHSLANAATTLPSTAPKQSRQPPSR